MSGGQLSSLELKVDEILALDPPPQDEDSREEEHMATVRKEKFTSKYLRFSRITVAICPLMQREGLVST